MAQLKTIAITLFDNQNVPLASVCCTGIMASDQELTELVEPVFSSRIGLRVLRGGGKITVDREDRDLGEPSAKTETN